MDERFIPYRVHEAAKRLGTTPRALEVGWKLGRYPAPMVFGHRHYWNDDILFRFGQAS